jgi:signal peptidase I
VTVAVAALCVVWFFWLRPVALGGPASYVVVAGVSMEPTYQNGDLVIAQAARTYHVGDVVAYHVPQGQPSAGALVIHRIIGGSGAAGFLMKGDNKTSPDPWRPTASEIVGRSWLVLPGVGRLSLAARTPLVLATLLGGLAGFLVLSAGGGSPRDPGAAEAQTARARINRRLARLIGAEPSSQAR